MKKVVVIMSGGLDSVTTAHIAAKENDELYGLSVNYGQTLIKELDMAKINSQKLEFKKHIILDVPINKIGAGALIDGSEIPRDRGLHDMQKEIPATYITFRNGILLSLAIAFAEANECTRIYGGWNVVDYSGYPDCRKEFLKAMENAANLGTKMSAQDGKNIEVVAPLLFLNKRDIIKKGLSLGVDYSKTWSCYVGGNKPCGECDSCKLRVQGFGELGLTDPLLEV
jgi:7-cyano-7-deazaguanine synthase